MSLATKKSSIHHHLTRPTFKKSGGSRTLNDTPENKAARVESGFGALQIGTEVLPVRTAYKPIFRF